MRKLGIEFLSVLGLPPVEFVNLAADLGCQHISTGITAFDVMDIYPPFSFREDAQLRRETISAMGDRGVSISLGEGIGVRLGADVSDQAADLDVMCELGVTRINIGTSDPDLSRAFDQFGALVEMAATRGMEVTVEFAPCMLIADLPTALAAVRHVGRPDFRLLIDTMHLVRSGVGAAEIAALDPNLIGYVQISDAPLKPRIDNYMEEATYERLAPGTGELGLIEVVKALPSDRVFGLEVPMRSSAQAGIGPYERLRPCVESTRHLFAQLDG